jgi:hypothetical protein
MSYYCTGFDYECVDSFTGLKYNFTEYRKKYAVSNKYNDCKKFKKKLFSKKNAVKYCKDCKHFKNMIFIFKG